MGHTDVEVGGDRPARKTCDCQSTRDDETCGRKQNRKRRRRNDEETRRLDTPGARMAQGEHWKSGVTAKRLWIGSVAIPN